MCSRSGIQLCGHSSSNYKFPPWEPDHPHREHSHFWDQVMKYFSKYCNYHLWSDVATLQAHDPKRKMHVFGGEWNDHRIERLPTISMTTASCKGFDALLCSFGSSHGSFVLFDKIVVSWCFATIHRLSNVEFYAVKNFEHFTAPKFLLFTATAAHNPCTSHVFELFWILSLTFIYCSILQVLFLNDRPNFVLKWNFDSNIP